MDMGIPPNTFLSELIEGLTLFFSIIEMVLLVTPARLASSRWESPLSLRMDCSRSPTSNAGASRDSGCRNMSVIMATAFSIYNTWT
jgi:hypothetical protein